MTLRSWFIALSCLLPIAAAAQTPPSAPAPGALRVYLDCSYCDGRFIRTELNYVNWVRDRADGQVHVLVSRERTGGGGMAYTLTFSGLRDRAGREDTLRYNTRMVDSDDVVRRGITRALAAGLVPFIASTQAGLDALRISWAGNPSDGQAAAPVQTNDRWNFWVFSLNARSNLNGESASQFTDLNGNVSANRTTNAYKVRLGLSGHYRESHFTYEAESGADTTVISIRRNYSIDVLAVKSYGPHWSVGAYSNAESATFGNIDLAVEGGGAVEYSLWPYAESTRRSWDLRYSVVVNSQNYRELTIYGKMAETHPKHLLESELDLRQRFGSVSFDVRFEQYLHNTAYYNASAWANTNVKLFKGFSLNFSGQYQRVRDQLSLAAGELTPEEVLLQQKQQQTDYRYSVGLGVGYSFGSIFNNVVNPRFGD